MCPLIVSTVDYHTAGEPFRIVSGGVPTAVGATVVERRAWAADHLDDVRRLLVNEPRGHADMYGGFVTPPDDDGAVLGVVFFHNEGYSTACGHGTIALATWAIDSGLVAAPDDGPLVLHLDVPSGRVGAVAEVVDGRARSVRFRNVPTHVEALDVPLDLGDRRVTVDLAYGGAFYATVEADQVGCTVTPGDLPRLIDAGRRIKRATQATRLLAHPDGPHLDGLYGVIFHEVLGDGHQRNVTVFADGEVDRSPCGSGTSARLAVLAERGAMRPGDVLTHDSIVGSRFIGRLLGRQEASGNQEGSGNQEASGRVGWLTEVEGRASRTGYHTFVRDPDDEVGTGFLLR